MQLKKGLIKTAEGAREASRLLAAVKTRPKNALIRDMARALVKSKADILKANARDIKKANAKKMPAALIDRLMLNEKRIKAMAKSISEIARLDDPVGILEGMTERPNGLVLGKMRVPIGVILVIYESRPNVTADCVALCLKSGNAIILRGGSEAINSNIAIFDALKRVVRKAGFPENSISLVRTTDRKAVSILLRLEGLIDLVIPRGGESLIGEVARLARMPVIKHYKGVCHVYVDEFADLNMAESVAFNAKVQRPGVCNAMETLLVHKDVAARFLPLMAKKFIDKGVELRGCPLTRRILKRMRVEKAAESDWHAEYLDLILSVRVVNSLEEAIRHINKYGTSHSDAIITDSTRHAVEFLERVDSGAVYVNASTRFTDGFEFGKGAEMGISTDKIHARGPVGLEELTTYKYIILGDGQIRK